MNAQDPTLQPQPVIVVPDAESRLAQLHAAYADAKARADEAAAQLKVVTDAIKAELHERGAGATRIELRSQAGPALSLAHSRRATFDSVRFKREHPETYVAYAKFSDSWTLRVLSSGGGES